MTALDRTFIKAFRRRETESDRPQPPELVVGETDDLAAPPIPDVEIAKLTTTSAGWQWPPICDELSRGAADGFEALAAEIEDDCSRKTKQVVAFAGSQAGVGCTSVLLTLARALAQRTSHPMLLVEANGDRPALCDLLQIVAGDGTPRTLGEHELAIVTLGDVAEDISTSIAGFVDDYPLILIDAGSVADPVDAPALWSAGVIGTAILVDYDDHDTELRNSAVEYLAQHSGMFLGVIETRREELCADVELPRMTG